jgi:NNP family nitrate/nitrite transporter-like MFS transporter
MPLLIKLNFPDIVFAYYAFLGAAVGSVTRPLGGWLADRYGGARVTLAAFAGLVVFTLGVLWTLSVEATFPWFLGFFLLIFASTGIGNGSTYKMIPAIFRREAETTTEAGTPERTDALSAATRQSSAALGIIGAVGALGGFLIPIAFSSPWVDDPLSATKGAFAVFACFYVACALVTVAVYLRRPARARALATAGI